jgi:trimeric autotransporter adhesin
MSTKTTFKRIALVAVASLGFGVLTSVAPANAASLAANEVVPAIATPFNVSVTTGTAITPKAVTMTTTNGLDSDTVSFAVTASVAPAGSTAVPTLTVATAATDATKLTIAQGANAQTVATVVKAATIAAAQAVGNIGFTPDVPGAYKLTVTATSKALGAGADIANSTVATYMVFATGIGARVASSGIGNTSATAVSGGQARINFVPALTTATNAPALAADTVWQVTSSGVGSIVNATGNLFAYASNGVGGAGGATATQGTNAAPGAGFNLPSNGTAGDFSAGARLGNGTTTTPMVFEITTSASVSGTQVLSFSAISATTGAPTVLGTQTIVWSSTASSASAALSSAFIGTGTGATCATADATASALRFSSTAGAVANICVTLRDSNGTAINGQSVSATVSGPGLIIAENDQNGVATGNARVAALTATQMGSTNGFQVGIASDGTEGVSTITISQGSTVIATKTLTFYGDVATLTATQNYAIARSGITAATLATTATANKLGSATSADAGTAVATSPAVTIVAKDAGGNVVPGVTVTAVIADATVISSVEIAEAAGAASTIGAAGRGTFLAAVRSAIGGVSGKSTTVTFRTPNPAVPGAFITADPVTFTLGGTKTGGTVTMTTDKATYEPGERMVITYKALDASGNKVYDGVSTGTPNASKSVQGLAGGEFVNGELIYGDGASTEFQYAPTVSGPFTLTLVTGTATGATISATATVGDDAATTAAAAAGDAAAEATDAANAATDAANAAAEAADAATAAAQDAADAVAALSTSVTAMVDSLRKQITSLTNLVIKIQRKVRA